MTKKRIIQSMEKLARKFDLEFEYPLSKANFDSGILLEAAIRNYFEPFFPERYKFTAGYMVDFEGRESNQCDWIIYDSQHTCPISLDYPVWLPYDGVYAALEIKRTLNESSFVKALDQIKLFSNLKRSGDSDLLHTSPYRNYGHIITSGLQAHYKDYIRAYNLNTLVKGIYTFNADRTLLKFLKVDDNANDKNKIAEGIINYFSEETKKTNTIEEGISLFRSFPDFIAIHNSIFIFKTALTDKGNDLTQFSNHCNTYSYIVTDEMTTGIFYQYLLYRLNGMQLNMTSTHSEYVGIIRQHLHEKNNDMKTLKPAFFEYSNVRPPELKN